MSIPAFGRSPAVAAQVAQLSDRLLAQRLDVRQARARAARSPFRRGAPWSPSLLESLDHLSEGTAVPAVGLAGVYGVGVTVLEQEERPLVLLDELLGPPAPERLQQLPAAFPVVRDLYGEDPPASTVALGIPAPVPYVGPGDLVLAGSRQGTLGALVTAASGRPGVLTAGHVASHLHQAVFSDHNNTRVRLGTVEFLQGPTTETPTALCADIAVIAVDEGARQVVRPPVHISGPGEAKAADFVTAYSPQGQQTAGLLTRAPWIHVPGLAGMWADIYVTLASISMQGNSGAPVLLHGTDQIVGHVVGGAPGVLTYVQAIDYQLSVAGCALRSAR